MTEDAPIEIALLRERVEARKLERELSQMKRPAWLKGPFWISTLSVVAAVFGIGGQHLASSRESAIADLQAKTAQLEQAQAEALSASLDLSIKQLEEELDALEADEKKARASLEAVLAKLDAARGSDRDQNARIATAKASVKGWIDKSDQRTARFKSLKVQAPVLHAPVGRIRGAADRP